MAKVPDLETLADRMDSWQSRFSGLNSSGDKRTHFRQTIDPVLTAEAADLLYNQNDLAALICELYPEEALAQGVRLQVSVSDDAQDTIDGTDIDSKLCARLKELRAVKLVKECAIFARVHCDCFIFIGVDDGAASQAEPLDVSKVRKINFLKVAQRTQLSTNTQYTDPLDPKFGEPQTYRLTPANGQQVVVHESRFLKMHGARASFEAWRRNGYWHFSVLQRIQFVLRDFCLTSDSAALLIQNASQGVFKLKGFLALLGSAGGAKALETRAQLMELGRGAANSILLDTEEEFDYKGIALTGVPEMLDRGAARLCTSAKIPVTKLTGVAAGGLNATGEGDRRNWQSQLNAYRTDHLQEPFDRILEILCIEQKIPDDVAVTLEFPPLEQSTDMQTAELRNKQALTDQIYVNGGVVTPEEVAVNRFPREGYSLDTALNLDVRKAVLEAANVEAQQVGDLSTVGARATAMLAVLDSVATESVPRDAGVLLLQNLFAMTPEQAEAQMGMIGNGFTIAPAPQTDPNADPSTGAQSLAVPAGTPAARSKVPRARAATPRANTR